MLSKQLTICPQTTMAHKTLIFLDEYFKLVGDQMPNSNEVHIDSITYVELHKEYYYRLFDEQLDEPVFSYDRFIKFIKLLFPHIRIREYKAVSGKCMTCYLLSEKRNAKNTTPYEQKIVASLARHHRSGFMSERHCYYKRRDEAINDNQIMSIIIDGMAQAHNELPWLGNKEGFQPKLSQHLQGVLDHGTGICTLYRTFHTIIKTGNLNVYCILKHLENWTKRNNRYPRVIYIQIDGGPENCNLIVFGILCLLIAKGFTEQIIMTRLPVGHTHEDIDSKFGKLWDIFRQKSADSPQMYRQLIERQLKNKITRFLVEDVLIIPDYEAYLTQNKHECFDGLFGHYAKEEKSQLQFKFQRVPCSIKHPLGCQVTFRSHSSDVYHDIVSSESHNLNGESESAYYVQLVKTDVEVKWFPETINGNQEQPLNILLKLPQGSIPIRDLAIGSREAFDKTFTAIKIKFVNTNKASIIKDWELFEESIPESDDAQSYVKLHPEMYNCPLRDLLETNSSNHYIPQYFTKSFNIKNQIDDSCIVTQSTNSIQYENNPYPKNTREILHFIDEKMTSKVNPIYHSIVILLIN